VKKIPPAFARLVTIANLAVLFGLTILGIVDSLVRDRVPPPLAPDLLRHAWKDLERGKAPLAAKGFRGYLALSGGDHRASYGLAVALSQMGEWEKSITALEHSGTVLRDGAKDNYLAIEHFLAFGGGAARDWTHLAAARRHAAAALKAGYRMDPRVLAAMGVDGER
jgi:hypothetical protein